MPDQEKTAEEVAQDLLGNEKNVNVPTAIYRVDAEKLRQYSFEAIADRLNELFGVFAIDISDEERMAEKMFLDGPLGPFLTLDEEKVDILP
jgi:hypothetical protein